MTKHAILADNYLMDNGFSQMCGHNVMTLEQLCEFALEQKLSHLWIHPSTEMRFELTDYILLSAHQWDSVANWLYPQNHPESWQDNYLVSLHGYKRLERGRTPRINIIFLEYASFDWKDLTPKRVMELVNTIEGKLGLAVGGSPAGVGLRYLQKCNEKHPRWLAKPTQDLTQIPFKQAARPLNWSRKPTEEELNRRFFYKFDRNSDFPRVAVDERHGIGDPAHFAKGRGFDHMLPGIWRIDVDFSPDFDFTMIPKPLWDGFTWLATPIVRFLVGIGCGIHVNEAWVFERYEYIFRKWGKNLWDYSQEYDRGTKERDAFKMIMNEPLGLIRSDKFGTDSFKYRPDWNATIVAGSRANVLRKVYKYAQDGYYPIMVRTDAMYYLSDEKEPNRALPGILDYAHSLGGYKLEW